MKCWIESLARLEDAEGDVDELAHHGADDELGWLALGGEALAEAPPPFGLVERDHGGHVEGAAQEGVADLGEARLAPDAAAGFVVLRVDPGEGRQLSGVAEPVRLGAASSPDGVQRNPG